MACTIASIPVAAVMAGGRPSVSSGSRTAMSGRMTGDETPRFSSSPTVMIETGVTSEPVPAVVGTSTSGRRGPLALPTPQASSRSSPEPQQQRGELGDVERRAAAEADDAGGAAAGRPRRRASASRATGRPRPRRRWSPRARRPRARRAPGPQRPSRRRPASVTNSTERPEPAAGDGAQAPRRSGLEHDCRRGVEVNGRHRLRWHRATIASKAIAPAAARATPVEQRRPMPRPAHAARA